MSGISGYLSLGAQNCTASRRLQEANSLIRHRGMDDEALLCLACETKQLKIYSTAEANPFTQNTYPPLPPDLKIRMGLGNRHCGTTREAAAPALFYDSALGMGITLDGAIYNHPEIHQELEKKGYGFEGKSDAELILKAFDCWGMECQNRFNGDWVFAIWDHKEQSLFCSRDRFGARPLYYLIHNDNIYLGSEIKQLLPFLPDRRLNHSQILRMMKINSMLNYKDETIWSQIDSLQPGECLNIRDGKLSKHFYYQLDPLSFSSCRLSFTDASESYYELFWDSLHLRTRDIDQPGVSLSGGLDSTAIFCALNQRLGLPAPAFSAYFEDDARLDERQWIKLVLERCGGIGYQLSPTPGQAWDALVKHTWHNDLPLGSGCPAQSAIMTLAKDKGIKILMGGQGADELFAGYRHAQYRYLADLLRQGKLSQFFRNTFHYALAHTPLQAMAGLGKTALSALLSESRLYKLEMQSYRFDPFSAEFHQAAGKPKPDQIADLGQGRLLSFLYNMIYSSSLQTLLHFEDRMAAASHIQSRTPFLDYRLVEFAFGLPSEYKVAPPQGKIIHRHAIASLVPPEIIARKDKSVFGTPFTRLWMRHDLKTQIQDLLYSPEFRSRQIWNLPRIHSHWQKYLSGSNSQAEMLYNIVAMELWLRAFAPHDELL